MVRTRISKRMYIAAMKNPGAFNLFTTIRPLKRLKLNSRRKRLQAGPNNRPTYTENHVTMIDNS